MVLKKVSVVFLVVVAFLLVGCNLNNNTVYKSINNNTNNEDYLRIHVRANSNNELDQNIKYLIKDEIVDYLTPIVATSGSIDELKNNISNNKHNIVSVINRILSSNGFSYKSDVEIANEFFPTRMYDDLVLSANYYDAIIVNLGEAKGDNWWCVVYPPLCFVNNGKAVNQNFIYKSKILELINKFFG